jgi:hypothetical protein
MKSMRFTDLDSKNRQQLQKIRRSASTIAELLGISKNLSEILTIKIFKINFWEQLPTLDLHVVGCPESDIPRIQWCFSELR